MSRMIDGKWFTEGDIATLSADGEYQREDSVLRHWIGDGQYPAAPNRYHLYIAHNCPWAHRTTIFRVLKKLEAVISVSVVKTRRTDQGWVFDGTKYVDDLYGSASLHEVYRRALSTYSGRVTVPVLFDKETETIVSNESSEIIRMLNSNFNEFTDCGDDFYPKNRRSDIDNWNEIIYHNVNNGVYRAGFASTQTAYDVAVANLFDTLDTIDDHLARSSYLVGDKPTEADWRLLPTLVRFDVAYFGAFKCNLKRIIDYPNIWRYARELYHVPGIAGTVKFDAYKEGYYSPSANRNPHGIVPLGPVIHWH